MFRSAYTHWKGRLSAIYKEMVAAKLDPEKHCPSDCMAKSNWKALCKHFESEKFKKKSKAKTENRAKWPYTHTSCSKSNHVRVLDMENESFIDNFGETHMKNGVYVNERAKVFHAEMLKRREEAKASGIPFSEREIMKETLGKRSGYERGVGHGVVASKCSKRATRDSLEVEALKEKLSNTEKDLQNAVACMKSQEELIANQQGILKSYEERCQRQDTLIESLKDEQMEIKNLVMRLLQQNNSASQS